MPNRYVRESAIESEAVNALSFEAEVFYRRLLNRADDFGRYTANLSLLRAALFPLKLDLVSEADVAEMLRECESCGLVFTYSVDGKSLMVLNKWEQGRAKESKYPPPPDDVCERMRTYVYRREHMSPTPTPTPIPIPIPTPIPTIKAQQVADDPLPFASPQFLLAWSDWKRHRAESRKPLKPTATRAQLAKLATMGEARAIAALTHSTANGYQGLFEPNPAATTTSNGRHANTAPQSRRAENQSGPYADLGL